MTKKIKINFVNYTQNKKIIDNILNNYPNLIYSKNEYDYLICIGGDGTYIDTLLNNFNNDTKILLIPNGNLNFFESNLNNIANLEFKKFKLLEIRVDNEIYFVINEIQITSLNSTNIYDVYIDEYEFYSFQGSGFYCCTSIGSSGFNRSVNGPLFFNQNLFCFNELFVAKNNINHYLDQPLILENQTINIYNKNMNKSFQFKIDGKSKIIESWNHISIKQIESCAKINLNYKIWLDAIKNKLI